MVEINVRYLFICSLWDIMWAFSINAGFGLFATETVPLLGTAKGRNFFSPTNLIMDLFWINLYSGFFIAIFVTWGVRGDLEKGKVEIPSWKRSSIPVLKYFPRYLLLRAFIFSFICLLTFFPLGCLALILLQVESLPYWNFIILKGIYGVMVSLPMTFLARICALGDESKILDLSKQ